MKIYSLILLGITSIAQADMRIYSNGMTCFQDANGFTYGCAGEQPDRGDTYLDMRSHHLIEQIGRDTAIDLDSHRLLIMDRPYEDERYED